MKLYKIQKLMEHPKGDKWLDSFPFVHMRKTYAEGAWAMLKAFTGNGQKHRLLCDGDVVATHTRGRIEIH